MNILYVSSMDESLEAILSGCKEYEGAPKFYYPWRKLVEHGHTVDFVVTSNFNKRYDIQADWFSENNIIKNLYAPKLELGKLRRLLRQVRRFAQLTYYADKAVRSKHYDFIYCKAFEGVAGQIVANLHNIPNGVRSFGDHMYLEIQKYGPRKAAIRNPLEYLCYQLKSDFILMSEDHKDQRITYDSWHNRKYNVPFYLWPSGIKFKKISELKASIEIPNEPYICFPARIDPFKRQDRVISTLKILHDKGYKLHACFPGGIYSESYLEKLKKQVAEYGLDEYVHFLGNVSQDDIKLLARNAIANILMMDGSSRNNVFYEILSVGAVVVGLDDGGINDYITNGVSGFLIKDENEAANITINLLEDRNKYESVREHAIKESYNKIMSIEERFDNEVELIEKVLKER